MGRPQTFDTAEAVRAARGVFRTKGYDNASMPDLEAATGLSRSSIYHAFGSKRGLFDAALASYLEEIIRPEFGLLLQDRADPAAVITYLTNLRAALRCEGSAEPTRGCLLIDLAASPIGREAPIGQTIADYRTDLARAVIGGVLARHPDLALDRAERIGRTCSGLIVAALALARSDPRGAESYVDLALELVDLG